MKISIIKIHMFQLKLPTKKTSSHTPTWLEQVTGTRLPKRVVSKHETTAYHRQQLAESIHKVCMKTFGFSGEAELTALKVCQDVEAWLEDKEEVTKQDIKRKAAAALHRYNPRAAYEYLPIKDYSVKEDAYGFIRL